MSSIGEGKKPAESDLSPIARRHSIVDVIYAVVAGAVGALITLVAFRDTTGTVPLFYQTGAWIAVLAVIALLFWNASSYFRLAAAQARERILAKQLRLRELELERHILAEKYPSGAAIRPDRAR